jgi:hypothetical protein
VSENTLMAELLTFFQALALGLFAWVIVEAVSNIATAVVKDRDNRRKHGMAMGKLEAAITDRRKGREPKRLL